MTDMLPIRCLIPVCLSFGMLFVAQNIAAGQYVRSESEAVQLGPKNKLFMDAIAEYRELTKKLTDMKIENQDASPNRRAEIDEQYSRLFRQGLDLHKKAIDLALDAHDETPNRNPAVRDLLYSTVIYDFNRENYEESVRTFNRLSASGLDQGGEDLYVFAGLAAMLSMSYNEADAWLKTARDSGILERMLSHWGQTSKGRSLLQTIQTQMNAMPQTKANWAREQDIRRAETVAGERDPAKKLPRVELTTSKGKIVLELFENEAPNTVANFISLVEQGYYDGIFFHRVLDNFMAQGGCPEGTGYKGPGYNIDCETGNRYPNARKHFRGSISMANGGPNTNGSQFFLTFVPTSHLDGRHTVFGSVVEGFEVLAEIQRVDPSDTTGIIPERDRIVSAKVLNKRNHAYEVRKNRRR